MKKTEFDCLYSKYKTTPLINYERHEIYEEMVEKARSFNDWTIVYRYGDNSYQYLALEHMKANVLKGKTSSDVQKNILELFELVTDEKEQIEILKAFLSKYSSDDDKLFVMTLTPWLVSAFSGVYNMSFDEIDAAIDQKEQQLGVMMRESTFLYWFINGVGWFIHPFF